MELKYHPNESRTKELLEYLVEKKLTNANKIYEEYKDYPLGPEEKKILNLEYINNLFEIKNMYREEVEGLELYTRGIALDIMKQYNISSNEVNKYIENALER